MLDCLFIGSTTKDTLLMVDAPPASDQRIAASAAVHACGGIASVAASAFQKLGGRTGLITAVGAPSDVTDFIRADIAARGLPYSRIVEIPGADSPFSAIQVEQDGKRCITHFGGCIRRLTLDMLDKRALQDAAMIHLGGLEDHFCGELAKYCREHTKALISVDGGNLSREATEALLPYTDVFIPDDKTVARTLGLSPEDACRHYAGKGVKTTCITLGDAGAVAYQEGRFYRAPPVSVSVVDTTGAGDNFHGAFLYCLTRRWDMEKTLRFCNAFAGLSCRGLGGIAAEPGLEETLRKMEE
ncbi:carbohydrate kinase family protein [Oscillibacter sp.]|uniref:carbohydrate kinase family protein n=1 Tax=Oscillibacter sp. TaxID=1945593 RepID=UPI002D8088BA|nr:PfkB family carbohydrate kinase [Oscillibacter sp.]